MTLEQFFYEHPVFRYEDFVLFKTTHGQSGLHAIKIALSYYVKQGRIINLSVENYMQLLLTIPHWS